MKRYCPNCKHYRYRPPFVIDMSLCAKLDPLYTKERDEGMPYCVQKNIDNLCEDYEWYDWAGVLPTRKPKWWRK